MVTVSAQSYRIVHWIVSCILLTVLSEFYSLCGLHAMCVVRICSEVLFWR